MLRQRRRRLTNIGPALAHCLVLAGDGIIWENTKSRPNVVVMLGQRRRRCTNITTTLG